jgi:hypothetical protein
VLCFPQDCFFGPISIGVAGLAAQTLEQQGARAVLFVSEEMHIVENQHRFLKSYFAKKTRWHSAARTISLTRILFIKGAQVSLFLTFELPIA